MKSTLAAVALLFAVSLAPAQPPGADPKDGEPLPELPKADPKSDLTPLNKEKTLYLEKKPDGTRRVLFVAEVVLREGPLEVFICKKGTKEHEAIARTDIDARFLHAALVAAGGKPGTPVQFVNRQTGDPEYKAATGSPISVGVHYKRAGKLHTHPAQEWISNIKTKKPMAHQWVFAGSRFVKNPERPNDPDYYSANNGEVIGISNFPDSMLDLPVQITDRDTDLFFGADTEKIPPVFSKIWVTLEPAAEKKGEKK